MPDVRGIEQPRKRATATEVQHGFRNCRDRSAVRLGPGAHVPKQRLIALCFMRAGEPFDVEQHSAVGGIHVGEA
jgi:hypothetical protein